MANDFRVWLNQEVWGFGDESIGRREAIYRFTESLTSWMKILGYNMSPQWGSKVVARWMYTIHVDIFIRNRFRYPVAYREALHRNWPEDLREFHYILDYDTISKFMEYWKSYSDFDQETHVGQMMFQELPNIVYPFIDMENSYNGQKVYNALYDSESDSDDSRRGSKRGGVDAYIADMGDGFHR
jgi:hypothetical protein